jgi:hypothetical protein
MSDICTTADHNARMLMTTVTIVGTIVLTSTRVVVDQTALSRLIGCDTFNNVHAWFTARYWNPESADVHKIDRKLRFALVAEQTDTGMTVGSQIELKTWLCLLFCVSLLVSLAKKTL